MNKKFSNRYFSLLVIVATSVVLAFTIPSDVSGYSFVGVTSNGVEFPIISYSISDVLSENNTGTGDSILDGIGVYLAIQNIGNNGIVYFGEDNTNHSSQTDIRAYVEVNEYDDWVVVIDDDDVYEILFVPEFGVEYTYDSGSLINVTNNTPNILGYTESRILSGDITVTTNNDGIFFSGNGEVVLKLHDYSNQSLLLRGDGTEDNVIKIITSEYDLINDVYYSNGYMTYSNNIDPGTNSFSVIGGIDSIHTGVLTFDAYGARNEWGIYYPYCWMTDSNFGDVSPYAYSPCQYKYLDAQITTTLVETNNGDHYTITGDSTTPTLLGIYDGYYQYNNNFNFKLYDTLPSVQKASFSDGSYEQVLEFPTQQTYMYVKLDGGTSTIKGEAFDIQSDVFFKVNSLLPDIAYDISKGGITGIVGKTSSTGEISLLYDDVDFGIGTSPGGILTIYPESIKYLGNLGVGLIDVWNDGIVELPVGDDLVYIPQNYVYWVFPVPVEISNVSVDDIPLSYLNGNYTIHEALYIPVIPSADTIYITINGEDVQVLMRDVATTTQIKQVPKESSVSSDHSTSGTASTTSNISTSTFLTATHTGIMYVNLDFKVGGAADFSMDSTYTGGFTKITSCKWHGASSPSRSYSCNDFSTPSNPASISNMVSLTEDHQTQLIATLNNGQVSNLTVEVDIMRNMGEDDDIESMLLYTSNSAQAYITSTFSEAGYNAYNHVHITYPLTSISENIAIPVIVGDMMEFVVRVNLEVSGAPAPSSADARYSSYVVSTTELGGGTITVGMS